jgi:hypothetical protein
MTTRRKKLTKEKKEEKRGNERGKSEKECNYFIE